MPRLPRCDARLSPEIIDAMEPATARHIMKQTPCKLNDHPYFAHLVVSAPVCLLSRSIRIRRFVISSSLLQNSAPRRKPHRFIRTYDDEKRSLTLYASHYRSIRKGVSFKEPLSRAPPREETTSTKTTPTTATAKTASSSING